MIDGSGQNWDAWVGREEHRTDRIDPGHFARWCAALDRSAPADGTVPQGFHWCLCLPDAPTARLGPDGHPLRDENSAGLLPPLADLPRRMWASSQVEFVRPLRVGEAVTRVSQVQTITAKQGSSGRLVFVDVAHAISGEDGPAVREVQTLVYREAPVAGSPAVPPPLGADVFDVGAWQAHRAIVPSEALLFRYSALTFNSHRIHYDMPYAAAEENYRGLVVHGPLTASLLLDLAARQLGDNCLKSFMFKGVSPAICHEVLHLVLRSKDAAIELNGYAADARRVMAATATV